MDRKTFPESRLLAFARRLQSAQTYDDLIDELGQEVEEAIGYNHVWISVVVPEHNALRVLFRAGPNAPPITWNEIPLIPIEGDAYVSQLIETRSASVVEDAQTDPRVNREVVLALGNRTVINVPLLLIDVPFGVLGTGTFGDEGVRLPSADEMDYLHELANQVVVASARILLAIKQEESVRQQNEIDRILASRQRLESLGELAGGVAHDFNNLLAVISASAQMLRDEIASEAASENLNMIETAAANAIDLTSRLLALGKRQQLDMAALDVNRHVQSAISMFSRVVPENVQVRFKAGEGLPAIIGDGGQLEQVVMNLLINARDSMVSGGTLTIESTRVVITEPDLEDRIWARPGEFVRITVTDTGEGISRDTLERIFEPFFTTKPEGEGTGLGLAVSRGIVEQHEGMINACSELGSGSTFEVYLPIAAELATV